MTPENWMTALRVFSGAVMGLTIGTLAGIGVMMWHDRQRDKKNRR